MGEGSIAGGGSLTQHAGFKDVGPTRDAVLRRSVIATFVPNIRWIWIQGGQSGQVVAQRTKRLIELFFSIGVKRIKDECNTVAGKYRSLWSSKAETDLMEEYGLGNITYKRGLEELVVPFELYSPNFIFAQILESSHPVNRAVPASQNYLSTTKDSLITIFLQPLNVVGSSVVLRELSGSFDCIVYHELIHACGDAPELRKIVDGVIRHTLVGCEAVGGLVASGVT